MAGQETQIILKIGKEMEIKIIQDREMVGRDMRIILKLIWKKTVSKRFRSYYIFPNQKTIFS